MSVAICAIITIGEAGENVHAVSCYLYRVVLIHISDGLDII